VENKPIKKNYRKGEMNRLSGILTADLKKSTLRGRAFYFLLT
jgi:hypothetical protein